MKYILELTTTKSCTIDLKNICSVANRADIGLQKKSWDFFNQNCLCINPPPYFTDVTITITRLVDICTSFIFFFLLLHKRGVKAPKYK